MAISTLRFAFWCFVSVFSAINGTIVTLESAIKRIELDLFNRDSNVTIVPFMVEAPTQNNKKQIVTLKLPYKSAQLKWLWLKSIEKIRNTIVRQIIVEMLVPYPRR